MLLVRLIQSLMNTAALPKTESSISNTPNTSKTVSIEALHHHTMTSNWGGTLELGWVNVKGEGYSGPDEG